MNTNNNYASFEKQPQLDKKNWISPELVIIGSSQIEGGFLNGQKETYISAVQPSQHGSLFS